MSRTLNKLQLIGHIGFIEAVETKGEALTRVSLATGYSYTSNRGDLVEHTDWHNLVMWGKNAENAIAYLKVGAKIYVEGSIEYQKYNKDGIDMMATKVKVHSFIMLDKKDDGNTDSSAHDKKKQSQQSTAEQYRNKETPVNNKNHQEEFEDDSIPF